MTDVHTQIAHTLTQEIVLGQHRIGAFLPTESELAERFNVSRPTVRASLKQLSGLGLTTSRRGSGHKVTTWWNHASPTVLASALSAIDLRSTAGRTLATDLLEARTSIAELVVESAARRRNPELLNDAADIIATMRRTAEVLGQELNVWRCYTVMQQNIVIRMSSEPIWTACAALYEAMGAQPSNGSDYVEDVQKIHVAIDMGMPLEAAKRMRGHLGMLDTDLKRGLL